MMPGIWWRTLEIDNNNLFVHCSDSTQIDNLQRYIQNQRPNKYLTDHPPAGTLTFEMKCSKMN